MPVSANALGRQNQNDPPEQLCTRPYVINNALFFVFHNNQIHKYKSTFYGQEQT
jgi:hypothetical protein